MTISNKQRQDARLRQTSTFLNVLLADEFMIASKTRNAFWNLNGPHFISLYLLFQNQYKILENQMDDLANRIQSLGFSVLGGLEDILKESHIQRFSNVENEGVMIAGLIDDHQQLCQIISSCEEAFLPDDISTKDTLIFMKAKHLQMIRDLSQQII